MILRDEERPPTMEVVRLNIAFSFKRISWNLIPTYYFFLDSNCAFIPFSVFRINSDCLDNQFHNSLANIAIQYAARHIKKLYNLQYNAIQYSVHYNTTQNNVHYIVIQCAIQSITTQCARNTIQCTIQYNTIQYNAQNALQYSTMYDIIQYNIMYNAILYGIIQFTIK